MKRIHELMSLRGRVAVITGGAGHIGQAMSEALAELGADIVIVDMASDKTHAVCDRLAKDFHVNALPVITDLEQDKQVRAAARKIVDRYGRLDSLVHGAAFVGTSTLPGWITPFESQSTETWRRALNVNLTAAFCLTQACTPDLRASGHGSVINIASIYGLAGPDMRIYEGTDMGNPAAYGASKGGLLQMTRWLATVLSPEIRVNAITPGGVRRNQPDIFMKRYAERTPLKRMATEEDLKGAVAFLASDLSSYVTGQNIIVDGGWTAW